MTDNIDTSTAAAKAMSERLRSQTAIPSRNEVAEFVDGLLARAEHAEARAEEWHQAALGKWELADSTAMRIKDATIATLTARVAELEGALIWCSGSNDFNEGGIAREGWQKICDPLLKSMPRAALAGEGGE